MKYYHPKGGQIINGFVAGVNAYIQATRENPALLPVELEWLGIKPQFWTPEVVVSRHQGLLGNIGTEMDVAKMVAKLGEERVKELMWFHPADPDLTIDPAIDPALFEADIMGLYDAFRTGIKFEPQDLLSEYRNPDQEEFDRLSYLNQQHLDQAEADAIADIGSNNWVVSGEHTTSGYPMMANDPHRRQAAPSLRYMAHLNAPGWNVIGGGEPTIPGISIGHNEVGAWGLTVFRTDAEDLYVYETNPTNPNQYMYQGEWADMTLLKDTIQVKGEDPVVVTHRYTRHGPVLYEVPEKNAAFALRCGWLEVGGSPYLASLRMDQAEDFETFREACNYSHIPGENMVWADRNGHIGWQAVGIAPIRRNFSGMVPVPGDGRYEWDGYLPIVQKPNIFDPDNGFFVTANANVTPVDYEHMDAIGFNWSDPYRQDRLNQLLAAKPKHSMADMKAYQTDYFSLPATELVPLLAELDSGKEAVESARAMLLDWDYYLKPESVAAGIYAVWEKTLRENIELIVLPEEFRKDISIQQKRVNEWLLEPTKMFSENATEERDQFLLHTLEQAINYLQTEVGTESTDWAYGNFKQIVLEHPLGDALDPEQRKLVEVGPAPRGGNSYTPNSTGSNFMQTHGASFRIIVDTEDWDKAVAMNNPGQSGDPKHPQYRNLFESWAKDEFFPLYFSKEKIEEVASYRIKLLPK